MAVPNTNTFSIKDVTTEIYGDTNSSRNLLSCFADSDAVKFDSRYGSKTMNPKTLLGFRNYNYILQNRFYTWAQVTDSRNIAPVGWHVPSESEWITLTTYASSNYGTSLSYVKALSSANGWNSTTNSGAPGNNQSLNNYLGFSANPFGEYSDAYGDSAIFYTSTEYNNFYAFAMRISYDSNSVDRYRPYKFFNLSVRCIRDSDNSNMYAYDYDGNFYTAVTIGTQTWLVQNLGCNHYRNGDLITYDY